METYFIILFANGLPFVKEILTSQYFLTNKAFQTSRMVSFGSIFDTIPLDWLFANATLLDNFL